MYRDEEDHVREMGTTLINMSQELDKSDVPNSHASIENMTRIVKERREQIAAGKAPVPPAQEEMQIVNRIVLDGDVPSTSTGHPVYKGGREFSQEELQVVDRILGGDDPSTSGDHLVYKGGRDFFKDNDALNAALRFDRLLRMSKNSFEDGGTASLDSNQYFDPDLTGDEQLESGASWASPQGFGGASEIHEVQPGPFFCLSVLVDRISVALGAVREYTLRACQLMVNCFWKEKLDLEAQKGSRSIWKVRTSWGRTYESGNPSGDVQNALSLIEYIFSAGGKLYG